VAWAPDYVTTTELKAYLADEFGDDTLAAIWVTTASRSVDGYCHRQFGKVGAVEAREYATVYDRHQGCWVAEIDDVQTVASMIVLDQDATELDDYVLGPVNALKKGRPYQRIAVQVCGPLTISALWGWTDVPAPVRNATLLQAARLAKRKDSPLGIAGSPQEQGGEVRLLAVLDPDLRTSLAGFRREVWAA
jgi:hypothetical protein